MSSNNLNVSASPSTQITHARAHTQITHVRAHTQTIHVCAHTQLSSAGARDQTDTHAFMASTLMSTSSQAL